MKYRDVINFSFMMQSVSVNGYKCLRRPILATFRSRSSSRASSSVQLRLASTINVSSVSSPGTDLMKVDAEEELRKLADYYNNVQTTISSSSSWSTTKTIPTIWNCKSQAATYVKENVDTVLFDCDGVLYRTLDVCPGAPECIQKLLSDGKKVFFVTNNAGINRRELKEKLGKLLGLENDLRDEQMVSSSYSCAQYLKQNLKIGSRVHVIGSAGLCEELANSGFEISGGPIMNGNNYNNNDNSRGNYPDQLLFSMNRQELADYDFREHPVDAVAVGHDIEFNFRKLCVANNLLIRNPEALFVATNMDSFDLVGSDRRYIPGNGCAVKALEYCTGKTAINVGKPSSTLADLIVKEHRLDPSRSLFVGDRLDTDIRFGNENGMKSLLVMTGVTTAQTMIELGEGTEYEPLPHFVAPYIGLLV